MVALQPGGHDLLHGQLAANTELARLPTVARAAEARHVETSPTLAAVARAAAGAHAAALPLAAAPGELLGLELLLQPRPLLPLRLLRGRVRG